jgi:hypothetical protein
LRINGDRRSLHLATADFLPGLVAAANFMRLSLRKAGRDLRFLFFILQA